MKEKSRSIFWCAVLKDVVILTFSNGEHDTNKFIGILLYVVNITQNQDYYLYLIEKAYFQL